MNVQRLGHIAILSRFEETDQILDRRILMVMTTVAGVGLFIHAARLQTRLGEHEPERMASGVAGLADASRPGHVTGDATPECMDAMDGAMGGRGVTASA